MVESTAEIVQQSDAASLPEKEDSGETTTQPSLDESTTDNDNESTSTTKSPKEEEGQEASTSQSLPPKEISSVVEDDPAIADTLETPSLQEEPEIKDTGSGVEEDAVDTEKESNNVQTEEEVASASEIPSKKAEEDPILVSEKTEVAPSEEVSENTVGSMTENSDIHDSAGEEDTSDSLGDKSPNGVAESEEAQNSNLEQQGDKDRDDDQQIILRKENEENLDYTDNHLASENDANTPAEDVKSAETTKENVSDDKHLGESETPVAGNAAEKTKSKRHKHSKKSSKRNIVAKEADDTEAKGEKEGKRDKMKKSSSGRSSKRNLKKEKDATEETSAQNTKVPAEESEKSSNGSDKLRNSMKKSHSNRKKKHNAESSKQGEDDDAAASSLPIEKTSAQEKSRSDNDESPPEMKRSESHRKSKQKNADDPQPESALSKDVGDEKKEREAKPTRSGSHRKSKKSATKNKSKDDSDVSGKAKSSVSFAGVTVHYHEVQVGNNLDCDGPPLALGNFRESEVYELLDAYEESLPYRPKRDPRLSAMERLAILQKNGITFNMIMAHLHLMEKQEKLAKERKKKRNRQNVLKPLMCVFGKKPNPSIYE